MEVSSPGLLRPLKKDKDFQRNLGEMIEMKLFKPLEGSKIKELEAELVEFDTKTITVLMEDDSKVVLDRNNLSLVRPAIEF